MKVMIGGGFVGRSRAPLLRFSQYSRKSSDNNNNKYFMRTLFNFLFVIGHSVGGEEMNVIDL